MMEMRMGMGMGAQQGVGGGPSGPVFNNAETATWYAALPHPTDIPAANLANIDTFIGALKATSAFGQVFDRLYLFAIDSVNPTKGQLNSLVNLVSPGSAKNAVRVGSGEQSLSWTAKAGWLGATNAALDTQLVPDGSGNWKIGNSSMMLNVESISASARPLGYYNNTQSWSWRISAPVLRCYMATSTFTQKTIAVGTLEGTHIANRTSTTSLIAWDGNNSNTSVLTDEVSLYPNGPFYMLARNENNVSIGYPETTYKMRLAAIGGGLTTNQMTDIRAAIATYLGTLA